MRRILPLVAMLSLAGCVGTKSIVTIPPASCAKLIPQSWADGVEGVAIPDDVGLMDPERVKVWQKALVGQTGQLSKANGRTGDVIAIFTGCEAMVNAARPKQ